MSAHADIARDDQGRGATSADSAGAALATAAWFAGHHDLPWTSEAALARLPVGFDGRDRSSLALALAAGGMTTRLVLRKLARLDPAVLPCVLFDRDGVPIVLLDMAPDTRTARIVEPGRDTAEREVSLRDLSRRILSEVMLVTVDDTRADARLAPDAPTRRGHWFWRPMRENWSGWLQVFLAALCVNTLGLALPIFVMNVYDRVIPNLAFVTLWTLAIGVGLALVLDWMLRTLRASVLERIGRRLDTGIASSLFRQAMNLRLGAHPEGAVGVTNHIRDFESVREFFGSASLVSVIDLLFIGLFIAVLYVIVGPLAFVPLLAIPAMLVVALAAKVPMARAVRQSQQVARRRQTVLIETLMGLETVKSLNAEPVMQREWDRASAASARIGGRGRFWSNFATNGTQAIQQFVSIGIIVWGVFLIAEGSITIGALIAANILASRALAPLGTIAQTIFRAQFAMRAMAALSEFMAMPPERDDSIRSTLRVTRGAVDLTGVNFRYPGADVAALTDVSLQIRPGDTVALIGRVGSGKSTLGKLLCGLLQPDGGTIVIDGHAIGHYDPAELRAGIGYLPQDPDLFTGTLRENLLIGQKHVSSDDIDAALHQAGIHGFVATLPRGLDQYIGEKGAHLSGGQRQGVALARLLLRRPKLLFLDEPTNAMDREMETTICARLRAQARAGTGLILCTHRPALANIAERMVVLDRGRKILDGPRESVIERLNRAAPDATGSAPVTDAAAE